MPSSRAVRGMSDGASAFTAARDSAGAAGDASTGLSHPANRRVRRSHLT
jgi:hypothetical protein